MFDIEQHLEELPKLPGVYIHKDKYGDVIYVGKATSLRSRVRQYFRSQTGMDQKTKALVANIAEFEYIVTSNEKEALILENNLIKRYKPRYNVMLRDDKTYPYIKITYGEKFPRLLKTRVLKNDGSKYFGPYADVTSLNTTLALLNDAYSLKRCTPDDFPPGHRPCLNGHIARCGMYCESGSDTDVHEEYMGKIGEALDFLKGKNTGLATQLKTKMKAAADASDFEEAARYRDLIYAAERTVERQKVELLSSGDMDIVIPSEADQGRMARVTVFFVRDGRLIGREVHHLDADADSGKAEIASAFLEQYYINQTKLPSEILLPFHIEDEKQTEGLLSEDKGSRVRLTVPERGRKKELLKLAEKDVSETESLQKVQIENRMESLAAAEDKLREASGIAMPSGLPLRLEAYDISNTGGSDSVAAMVVFVGGEKKRSAYRRFRIRSEDGSDDYGAMQETVYRRLRRGLDGDPGFIPLPDIILVDGGKGHVSAVRQITAALKTSIPVLGMVKDDRHRTRGLVTDEGEMDISKTPDLYRLIGVIQEEVHRFAIEYHRGLRSKRASGSELDGIPGIGEKRRNALLEKFGSIAAISEATLEQLTETPGMNPAAARSVNEYFKNKEHTGGA